MQERIETHEFLPLAEHLQVGQSVRAKHCNNNRTMIVSRGQGKVTAHCFRCDGRGFHAEQENFQDKLNRIAAERNAEHDAVASHALPEPRVYDLKLWPRDAALWLYKSGFSPSMIARLGAYWCPELGRVVLPIMEDDHAVFWQARAIERKPKIISPKRRRDGLVAKYGVGDTLVLCEDILSAFKVGQVTEAWALMGTAMSDAVFTSVIAAERSVIVWLDGDAAGLRASAKIIKGLRAYGVQATPVITSRDPKLHTREEIKCLIASCGMGASMEKVTDTIMRVTVG